MIKHTYNSGFTLYVAITISAVLLVIVTSLVNLSVKQSIVSHTISDSQQAFYAADSALECAFYWDVKNSSGSSAFDPEAGSGTDINCNVINDPTNHWVVGGSNILTTNVGPIHYNSGKFCAEFTVKKTLVSPGVYTTAIEAKGYNTCDLTAPRRVERAVRATY